MDFWVILYSLVCVAIGGGFVAMLYNRGQQMGAMVLLVLIILVFLFYGLRWFPGGNLNGTKPGTVAWPPIVNVCPDFMVSWTDNTSGKVYCYDAANIYGLQAATAAPPLQAGLTIGTASSQSAYLLKDPAQGASTSTLAAAPARWPLASAMTTSSSSVLTPTAKYLRWEGVWDGQTLSAAKAPLP
jgi:hypothetical protein